MAPPELDRAIRKCLAKDPEDRWQTTRDLVSELRWIAESGSRAGAPTIPTVQTGTRLVWAAVAVLGLALVAALAVIWTHVREIPAARPTVRFTVTPPAPYVMGIGIPALSPDGTKLAFTAAPPGGTPMLFMRALDTPDAKAVPETAGASWPFWSPDSQQLGFFSGGKLKKVGLSGGPMIALADGICCGTWSRDGGILFAAQGPIVRDLRILRISGEGGAPAPVTRLDTSRAETLHRSPVLMPDGRSFLYFVYSSRPDVQGIYAASLESEQATKVTSAPSNVAFVQPGFLVYRLGGRLVAQPFDWKESRLTGEAVQVAESVAGTDVTAYFSAVRDALAYIPGVARPTTLTWLDRKGNRLATVGERGEYSGPALSPDGRTLAVGLRDPATQTRDIWLIDLVRGIPQRFTFDPADDFNPAWSPDGSRIAFTSARKGQRDIWEKAASGVGEERLMLGSEIEKNMEYWPPDGRLLLFNIMSSGGARQVWALPLEGDRKPFAVLSGPADVQSSPLSPNGKLIAYSSSESKRYEIFIQDFPHARNRWRISTEGGMTPQWRADGEELFYMAGSRLMAADIKVSGTRMEAGAPHLLFEVPFATWGRNTFVPSRDGQRFLAILQVEQPADLSITVERNWMSRLKQ